MHTTIKKFTIAFSLAAVLFSCKKEEGPLTDKRPDVSVTVTNAFDFRPDPTVTTTLAASDSIIKIVMTVPSGKTIKEITKVATSTSYAAVQSTGTTGFYTLGTVTGAGSSTVTFTTSLRQYILMNGATTFAVNTELARRFYFIITLTDGTKIVPAPVRVLIL